MTHPARPICITLEGNSAELIKTGGGHALRGPEGLVLLAPAEVSALRDPAADLYFDAARAGLTGPGQTDLPSLAATRSMLWNAIGDEPLAVLLDSTTKVNALRALRSRSPGAIELLDLAVLTVAAACFDTVVIQFGGFSAAEPFRAFSHDMLTSREEESSELELAHEAATICPQRSARYGAAWAAFLGLDEPIDLDFEDASRYFKDGYGYAASFDFLTDHDPELHARSTYFPMQTIRAVFHDLVAGAVGLPYLPSSIRLPASADLARSRAALLSGLRSLAIAVAPSDPPPPETPFAPPQPLYAPFLLGLVLSRMERPSDYVAALGYWRDRFTPFREWLRTHPERGTWEVRPHLLREELARRLGGAAGSGTSTSEAVAFEVLQGAASLSPVGPVAAPALKVLRATQPASKLKRLTARLFKPELYVLFSVADEARNISTLGAEIARIWGTGLDDGARELLARIRRFDSDPFLTPRTL